MIKYGVLKELHCVHCKLITVVPVAEELEFVKVAEACTEPSGHKWEEVKENGDSTQS